jgi:hypothetical protein
MRIVMRYCESDGCTYHCENIHPIEYESVEAAIVDFEKALEIAGYHSFTFAGRELWGDAFYSPGLAAKRSYQAPEFLTLDEWFGEEQ